MYGRLVHHHPRVYTLPAAVWRFQKRKVQAPRARPTPVIAKYGKFEYVLAEHYRFEDELGRGAMGTVYRAKDVRLGRPVAIKMLHPMLTNELGVARFQSEIRIAAGLHHPNIIGVHDCGEADGRLFYVMDYLGGETLRDRLDRETQLAVDDALAIVEQVAEGLQYAHEHGVVHRDIKPENILLAEGRACLVDFGLARALGDVDTLRLTASGISMGTPHYLSPEQAAAEKEVGPKTDQYSLACVLYEMLAGEPPFTGPTAASIAMRHLSEAPRPLQVRRHSTPKGVDAAVMRAMEKVPADRFPTVRSFARALRATDDAPIAELAPRPFRSHATFLAVAMALAVTAAALVVSRIWRETDAVADGDARLASNGSEMQRRIAVLYFDDNSDQHQLRYLADGLTESVIAQLSAVQGLAVVSRNGVKQFRDSAVAFDKMVKALGVGSVVEGSLRNSGDSIQVTVRLVDAESGVAVGSTNIVRPANSVVSLEDEIGYQVSMFLRRRLGEHIRLMDVRAGTRNEKALDLVLRAERIRKDAAELAAHADSIGSKVAIAQQLRRADQLLTKAEAEDPRWTRPIVARGWIALEGATVEEGMPARLALLKTAYAHARHAFVHDSLNPTVLELIGTVEWNLATVGYTAKMDQHLVDAARAHLQAAVSADTNLAGAWATLSTLLGFSERPEEVREADLYAKRALEADAYLSNAAGILHRVFRSALHLGDTASARTWCGRGKQTAIGDARFVECDLTLMLYANGRPEPLRAWSIVQQLDRLDPPEKARAAGAPYDPVHRRMMAAIVSARAGDTERARAELARARREVAGDSGQRIDLLLDEAVLWYSLGARDSAAERLRMYIHSRGYRQFLTVDPLLAPIMALTTPGSPRY